MGSDWKHFIGAVITGLVFSFLGAKLISIVSAFKDHARLPASDFRDPGMVRQNPDSSPAELTRLAGDHNSVTEELMDGGDGDNDWERVRSSELDEELSPSPTFGSGSGQAQTGQVESSSWVMI